jgi:hypothetical protein
MIELLEIVISIWYFSSENVSDVPSSFSENSFSNEAKLLGTSPTDGQGNEISSNKAASASKNRSDSEICKALTDKVTAVHNKRKTFHPISVERETDDKGREHIAVAAGGNYYGFGNQTISGCASFPGIKKK